MFIFFTLAYQLIDLSGMPGFVIHNALYDYKDIDNSIRHPKAFIMR